MRLLDGARLRRRDPAWCLFEAHGALLVRRRLRDEAKELETRLSAGRAEIQTLKVELHRRGKALTVVEEKLAGSQSKILSLEGTLPENWCTGLLMRGRGYYV